MKDLWVAVRDNKGKAVVSFVSTLFLVALLSAETWSIPYWTDFWQSRPIWASIASTLSLAGLAWGAFLIGRQRRISRINQSVTGIGLAGLVIPLLRVNCVLREAINNGAELMNLRRAAGDQPKATKWAQICVEKGELASAQGDALGTSELRVLAGDCIQEVVGSVRDWVDVLAVTDLGQEAMYCLQTIRRDLQEVQVILDQTKSQPGYTQHLLSEAGVVIRQSQKRALFLAITFELASYPLNCRKAVLDAANIELTGTEYCQWPCCGPRWWPTGSPHPSRMFSWS